MWTLLDEGDNLIKHFDRLFSCIFCAYDNRKIAIKSHNLGKSINMLLYFDVDDTI